MRGIGYGLDNGVCCVMLIRKLRRRGYADIVSNLRPCLDSFTQDLEYHLGSRRIFVFVQIVILG